MAGFIFGRLASQLRLAAFLDTRAADIPVVAGAASHWVRRKTTRERPNARQIGGFGLPKFTGDFEADSAAILNRGCEAPGRPGRESVFSRPPRLEGVPRQGASEQTKDEPMLPWECTILPRTEPLLRPVNKRAITVDRLSRQTHK